MWNIEWVDIPSQGSGSFAAAKSSIENFTSFPFSRRDSGSAFISQKERLVSMLLVSSATFAGVFGLVSAPSLGGGFLRGLPRPSFLMVGLVGVVASTIRQFQVSTHLINCANHHVIPWFLRGRPRPSFLTSGVVVVVVVASPNSELSQRMVITICQEISIPESLRGRPRPLLGPDGVATSGLVSETILRGRPRPRLGPSYASLGVEISGCLRGRPRPLFSLV